MGPIGLTGLTGTMGPAITTNNYTWAIKTNTQLITNAATFGNILFTSTPEINGWAYNISNGNFLCNQSGKYYVSYMILMSSVGGSRNASIRGAINAGEIIGSALSTSLQSTSSNQPLINHFIMNISQGNTFALQVAGSAAGSESIDIPSTVAGETPISGTIAITRIS